MQNVIDTIKQVYEDVDDVRVFNVQTYHDSGINTNETDWTISFNHYLTVDDIIVELSLKSAIGAFSVTVKCKFCKEPIINNFLIDTQVPLEKIIRKIQEMCNLYYY